MDDEEIVRLLNEAFIHEVENTMVYVRNSFIMKECDVSRITEGIAVDEMRHMWWLAELITKRGGKPSMEHRVLDFGGDGLKGQLERQIALETEAIEMYKRMIELVNDPEVVGVARHILDEERRHRKEFKERLSGA
ncbi:Ferritin-like domain protein [Methanocella conradii HZ254]|uniref:Ferritin-like domain protein n=1 Tax=Methanocella conradii (strain DSM 24694 / JCM 17849 / CGMCC 1.5162 / HZ254) TaxID=1041930 RepID=H8I7D8_METCZ|nr:ferritin-like domain-containing protein [Methanocella conradii]AFD00804.1 Ferritin-like domain protein [Methanocella conradii HZ254]MDI6897917.1 ferritin-like domain-containing protein [Methanocella conradii]